MATLYIEFRGICVHFRREFHPSLPARHRAVLINGREINGPIRGAEIPPHYALLRAPDVLEEPMFLTGGTLRVRNQVDAPCVYDPTFDQLPNLTRLMESAGETLGPPSMAVLLGENSALTSSYFDFNGGTFYACQDGESASVSVAVETSGDSENVMLDFHPFPTAPFPVLTPPMTLELSSGSVIRVSNICADVKDRDTDFYLSYLTAAIVPIQPVIPARDNGLPLCPERYEIAGPGCSDSTYP